MEKRYRKMERKASGKIREIRGDRVFLELPLPVAEVISGIPDATRELSEEVGLMLMTAAMNSECERVAGAENSRNFLRTANWWGSELSPVYFGGQKMFLERPRLRGKDNREIALSTYKAFRNPGGMKGTVMKNMILGISSRNYEEAVEGLLRGSTA